MSLYVSRSGVNLPQSVVTRRKAIPVHTIPDVDDSDEYFGDDDPDFYESLDDIESSNGSPTRTRTARNTPNTPVFHPYKRSPSASFSQSRPARTHREGSQGRSHTLPSSRATAYPITPPRSRSPAASGTPDSRAYGIRNAFAALPSVDRKSSMARTLFPNALSNDKAAGRLVDLDSDEYDEDYLGSMYEEDEALMIFTDTDSSPTRTSSLFDALSPTTSVSSINTMYYRTSTPSTPQTSSFTSLYPIRKHGTSSQSSAESSNLQYLSDLNDGMRGVHPRNRERPTPSSSTPASIGGIFGTSSMLHNKVVGKDSNASRSSAVDIFLSGRIGIDLTVVEMAHCSTTQKLLDREHISWGVQYELARGVTAGAWKWSDITLERLRSLTGSNAEAAYRVRSVMLGRSLQGIPDLSIWKELDREQLAILENQERGLGLMGPWEGDPDWHGGQIQQLARLIKDGATFVVQLEPLEKRRSHRLARYLGSRRILQLRISKDLINKEIELKRYLSQKFVLCGRVYVPLHAKDDCLYMVETNEDWERQPGTWCGDDFRRSFAEIVQWHNPLDLNMEQPISKWSTRFALALSNSIPALMFDEKNIFHIDDIYGSGWLLGANASAEQIMTDGCGFINAAAAIKLGVIKIGHLSRPTAFQGRFKGAKGLWIIHPSDNDSDPRIWIRRSQTKIEFTSPLDRAHRIFDLLCTSHPSPFISLSKQSIINLWHNGVPDDILVSLFIQGLTNEVDPLMDWTQPQAMVYLWDTINKLGNVSGSRIQRLAAHVSRALGLQGRDFGHDDVGTMDNNLEESIDAKYTGRNEHSGGPLALHEAALELIQSGFRPEKLSFLRGKIRYIVSKTIDSTVEKYQIHLPESLSGFIVPDPINILKEGQIYYRSSESLKDPETLTLFNVLTGELLLGRYPVRLPSDIQKVTAVDIPELYDWPDVIIVSTKGTCSLASLLSGGDYDGDELFVIREASIVQPFKKKTLTTAPANLIKENFEREVESVTAFAERAMSMSAQDAQRAFQEALLLSLNDSKVGLYSGFHDYAVWKYGYAHPKTVRLAYMFNTLLDSSKTGLRLKPEVFAKDRAAFGGEIPEPEDPQNGRPSTFILHSLSIAGKNEGDRLLSRYDEVSGQGTDETNDPDLKAPYTMAQDHASAAFSGVHKLRVFTDELHCIRSHVSNAYNAYRTVGRQRDLSSAKKKPKQRRLDQKEDLMLPVTREYAQDIPDIFLTPNVREVKASYAYHLNPAFAFTVAFRDLCDIKAHAAPRGVAPSIRLFDEVKTIPHAYLKALARSDVDRQ